MGLCVKFRDLLPKIIELSALLNYLGTGFQKFKYIWIILRCLGRLGRLHMEVNGP
jgi:hypothetical protein